MIPKIIHYVWVGKKEKPAAIKRCMKTWKKYMPDWEIKEWNEENFDINSIKFTKEAYKQKKWAFVSDYIRLYAVYKEGGIYLDTDIIIRENLEKYLGNTAFIGFEDIEYPFTAVFGARKGNPFVKRLLDEYDKVKPIFDSSNTNTKIVSNIIKKEYGVKMNDKEQLLKDDLKIYSSNTFSFPSLKSSSIHTYSSTWYDGKTFWLTKIDKNFKSHLTNDLLIILYNIFYITLIIPKKKLTKYLKR
ncbi:MAG: glycosyltransferase, partial [Clostridia bacterium]